MRVACSFLRWPFFQKSKPSGFLGADRFRKKQVTASTESISGRSTVFTLFVLQQRPIRGSRASSMSLSWSRSEPVPIRTQIMLHAQTCFRIPYRNLILEIDVLCALGFQGDRFRKNGPGLGCTAAWVFGLAFSNKNGATWVFGRWPFQKKAGHCIMKDINGRYAAFTVSVLQQRSAVDPDLVHRTKLGSEADQYLLDRDTGACFGTQY